MKAIGEDGLPTLLSFKNEGYNSIHIYDCINNLILVSTLANVEIISQLNEYIKKDKSMITYLDICLFHKEDSDLSAKFYELEK